MIRTLCVGLCFISSSVLADNWPGWRGPQGNGVAAGKAYPVQWDKSSNVLWKVPMQDPGGSTPVVWGDRTYVTLTEDGKNIAVALDSAGKEIWRQAELGSMVAAKHKKASGCNPSPTTDGKFVFAYFKSGDFACLDAASGEVVWSKNLQKEFGENTLWWDLGSSPVLTDKYVIATHMQTGPSYLVAMEKATGKIAWKNDRKLDAPLEAAQSYTTPLVTKRDGNEVIYVLGADHVTAHAADSGKEIWRLSGLNPTGHKYFRSISSPVLGNDHLFAPYARGATLTAVRLGGSGDVTKSNVAWMKEGISADVPTPAFHNGKVYLCSDKGKVTCVTEAGDEVWSDMLPRHRNAFSASPIVAGDHLYLTRENGTTYVLNLASDKFDLVATNPIDEKTVATPVFANGKVLLRTFENLYCFGQ